MTLDAQRAARLRPSRRHLIAAGLGAALPLEMFPLRALAAVTADTDPRSVSFQVWRKTAQIGTHAVKVVTEQGVTTATIAAQFVVSIGPIPVFHYHHAATEVWRDGRFATLDARSVSNGRVQTVRAVRTAAGVTIQASGKKPVLAVADAAPLTHWNFKALSGAMFNPQTGEVMGREHVRPLGLQPVLQADGRDVQADAFALTGEAQITDFYDAARSWAGLKAKVMDGSFVEYRRVDA